MLDLKFIRANPEMVKDKLKQRGSDAELLEKFLEVDQKWRSKIQEADASRQNLKNLSEKIGQAHRAGGQAKKMAISETEVAEIKNSAKEISDRVKILEDQCRQIEEELEKIVLEFPNLPADSVPAGTSSADNVEIRKLGEIPKLENPKPHWEIGQKLGIFDFERAAKVSGSRFVCLKGAGAALERALIDFMVDLHVKEHGYLEVMPPVLVNTKSMFGTGQLPKFDLELYKCRDTGPFAEDDYYLIPTAEVCVTNLLAEEILSAAELPIKYVAYTPCFRREAGSYGKDTKGLIRIHQFNKVELVKFCTPEKSFEELETLVKDAETVLQKLELPYRLVELCAGDLGFGAAKTYDLEVWFPAAGAYKEISSCSNFTDFQSRRAGIRYRPGPPGRRPGPQAKPELVHTLNGSGLAVGRTMAAILENFQTKEGQVILPEVLQKYFDLKILE